VRSWGALALVSIGPAAVPELVKCLAHKNSAAANSALQALEDMGGAVISAAEIPALRRALESDDPAIRAWSVRALGHLGQDAEAALPALLKTLHDKDGDVRLWTVRALRNFGTTASKALPALNWLLGEATPEQKEEIRETIAQLEKGKRRRT
jgi:HEAT repeat protein